jgi:hypothetical protein
MNFDIFVNYLYAIQFYLPNIYHYLYNTNGLLSPAKINVRVNKV